MLRKIVFLITILFSIQAHAEYSGEMLLEDCGALVGTKNSIPTADFPAGICAGYIRGFNDLHEIVSILRSKDYQDFTKHRYMYCAPENVRIIQVARILVKYLNDHPEKLHLEAKFLFAAALRNAFPCESRENLK